MYFIHYEYEVIGDYSVDEKAGSLILEEISGDMEDIKALINIKTGFKVTTINEVVPLKTA